MTPPTDVHPIRMLEAIDGPYVGFAFRIPDGAASVEVRPNHTLTDRPLERYRVIRVAGDVVLRHVPRPDPADPWG